MPSRFTPALFVLLASAAVASAEPFPATYFVRVNAPDGYDGILFGTEVRPPETDGGAGTKYSHYWDTEPMRNYGMVRLDNVVLNDPQQLFSFGPGFAQKAEVLPADKRFSPGVFRLSWGVTPWGDGSGGVIGSTTGTFSVDGVFTSGTGKYLIGLDHTESFTMNGQAVELRFTGVNRESGADIEMSVTPIESTTAPNVPEPGTLILGGIAVVGGVGAWVRKRRLAKTG